MAAALLLSGCANITPQGADSLTKEHSDSSLMSSYKREMAEDSDYSRVCGKLKKFGWKTDAVYYSYSLYIGKNGNWYCADISPTGKIHDSHEVDNNDARIEYAQSQANCKTFKGDDCKVYFYQKKDGSYSGDCYLASKYVYIHVFACGPDEDGSIKKEIALSLIDLAGKKLTYNGYGKLLKKFNAEKCEKNISFGLKKGKHYMIGAYEVRDMKTEEDAVKEEKDDIWQLKSDGYVHSISKKGKKGIMYTKKSDFQYRFRKSRELTLIEAMGGDKYETRKKLVDLLTWG